MKKKTLVSVLAMTSASMAAYAIRLRQKWINGWERKNHRW